MILGVFGVFSGVFGVFCLCCLMGACCAHLCTHSSDMDTEVCVLGQLRGVVRELEGA